MLSIFFIIEFFKLYVMCFFILSFKKVHKAKWGGIILFSILLFIDLVTLLVLNLRFLHNYHGVPFIFIGLAIFFMTYISGDIKNVIYMILFQISFSFFDFIVLKLISGILGITASDFLQNELYTLIFILPSLLILLLIRFFFLKNGIKLNLYTIKKRIQLLIFLAFFGIGHGINLLFSLSLHYGMSYSFFMNFIAVCGGLALIIIILLYFNKHNTLEKSRIISELRERMYEDHFTYIKTLGIQDEETRKFRHDITIHFRNITHLLHLKKYESLTDYVKELNYDLQEINNKSGFDTGNITVNNILNGLCLEYNTITVEWKGVIDQRININMKDLSSLFANLLYNAFEASNQVIENPYVKVKVMNIIDGMYISVINNYKNEPNYINSNFITKKNQTKNHGYGTKIIQDIVVKYNGDLVIEYKNKTFTVEITLPSVILDN